jgi:hypothetical protein
MRRSFIIWLSILSCVTGCELDIPYKEELDRAVELKAEAERKLAEAQAAAEEAKKALAAEQNAINRLYTED